MLTGDDVGVKEPGLKGSKILTLTDCYGFSEALERGSAPDLLNRSKGPDVLANVSVRGNSSMSALVSLQVNVCVRVCASLSGHGRRQQQPQLLHVQREEIKG